jgi:hypothetical protein
MATQTGRDPDQNAIAIFKNFAMKNPSRSASEGRPIFDDMEIVEIRFPGSRSVSVFPATSISHWQEDPVSGELTAITYAERFNRQYKQFKQHSSQTKSGTPLEHAPFLTEARRAELRALNVYTVENLAAVDGQELKNLGTGGRELKNKAIEYLEEAKRGAANPALMAELEALRARNQVLEEDLAARGNLSSPAKPLSEKENFADMDLDQLREFIKTQTGHAPHGSINRKTLVRMATEAQSKAA